VRTLLSRGRRVAINRGERSTKRTAITGHHASGPRGRAGHLRRLARRPAGPRPTLLWLPQRRAST